MTAALWAVAYLAVGVAFSATIFMVGRRTPEGRSALLRHSNALTGALAVLMAALWPLYFVALFAEALGAFLRRQTT